MRITRIALPVVCCLVPAWIFAQSSASYSISGQALNSGGNPINGVNPQSASYKVTLDAIGDALAPALSMSPSFVMVGGTGAAHRPPGEVSGLLWTTPSSLTWNVEPSAGIYNVYRGPLTTIVGSGFGTCFQQDLLSTTASDSQSNTPGTGRFYLVTVENVLGSEGTKGFTSAGGQRSNPAPCP